MRKIALVTLMTISVFALSACVKKAPTPADNENNTTVSVESEQTTETTQENKVVEIAPEVAENTAGSALWNEFITAVKENPELTAVELSDKLSANPVIQFMAGAMETQPGYLAGFSEEITGFESGATYGPMMGSIAFVGHIFKLAEDADVNAFIENLKSKADPRWNICVEADYVQAGAYGNTVYFLMYPASMDEASEAENGNGAGSMADAEIIAPEVDADTWGALLWDTFVAVMNEEPTPSAIDAAFALSMDPSIQFMAGSMEVVPGYLAGFDADIDGFKSAGQFGPMMGSIAFVGYVFELDADADVNAFIETLTTNSNPRWNICVEADQTVAGAVGNYVFFVMCPASNQ